MKVKNFATAVSLLAAMGCDGPTTNFMALGQCNCSNYFTVERQARARFPVPGVHDLSFP